MTKTLLWWDLTTAEFAARDLSETVAILPVGAVEQHGPHLPVSVDAAINAGILAAALELLPAEADVLVLPPLPFGKSDEHTAYPGTLTLSGETLGQVWFEIAASVARAGCRKILLFNSHGGQMALMDIVCRRIRVELGVLAIACSWFRATALDDLFSRHELTHGIHGGELETSVMLALHPGLIAMHKAEDFVPLTVEIERSGSSLTAEGLVGFGWQAQDLHPAGVSGNAAAATADKGEQVVRRAAEALVRLIRDAAAFDLARLTQKTRFTRATGA
ncbi:MAG: creatininase family protein [Ancalomicrobiaceae bacterium]|nr:creatininase family protein [Ancalomicrobiaceae bacterium]